MVGTWTVTVEGEARQRTMVIQTVAQKGPGAYVMLGTFSFQDQKPYAFRDGEIQLRIGGVLVVRRFLDELCRRPARGARQIHGSSPSYKSAGPRRLPS